MAAVHSGVVGSFRHLDSLVSAIEGLKQAGEPELFEGGGQWIHGEETSSGLRVEGAKQSGTQC